MDDMRAAIDAAVSDGHAELRRLDELCDDLSDGFRRRRPAASVGEPDPISTVRARTREVVRGIRRHLDAERDSMETFNIAFFGRTGAGKSTLLSAFGELNGKCVSPGASDWTKKVEHIDWHGCRLLDTPGINGWGRGESRESLEATARRAVETADIVLLCFDSQSQHNMEFAKIAAWIQEFGKPTIAVLNVRNVRWRHPLRVAPERRANLSEAVRQHVDNIQTELGRIGLTDTPVVALQSRRALFARASTPFMGPAAEDFASERAKYGVDYLAKWSNFETLADLVSATITEGGGDLRLGALRADLRSRCHSGASSLEATSHDFVTSAEARENEAAHLLTVLGYPRDEERQRLLGIAGGSADWLARSEELRGVPYTGSTSGSLDRFVQHQLVAHLAALRRASGKAADRLVDNAFENGESVGQSTFSQAVFDVKAIEEAVAHVWSKRAEFLERELRITAEQAPPESQGALTNAAHISATNGNHIGADVLRGAGIAAGAAAVAVPFALANFWNPAGWAAGAAAVGVGIAGQVQQHFGKKMKANARAQAQLARAQAIADSRRAVAETYDNYERAFADLSRSEAWDLLAPLLSDALRASAELREAAGQADDAAAHIRSIVNELHSARGVGDVLHRAQAKLAPTPQDLQRILLGEDWLADEYGHRDVELSAQTQQVYSDHRHRSHVNLSHQIDIAWGTPLLESIQEWAESLEDEAADDEALMPVVRLFRTTLRREPTFAVLGDYNAGKSSLIRRILVDGGHHYAPTELEIRARPTTALATSYQFPRFELVDTPGLQSTNTEHDRIATETVTPASLIFVVLHINLLIGSTTLLEEIAHGSDRLPMKANRLVFLINRSDELGVDPLTSPSSFLQLQERKREELTAALASLGIRTRAEQVHCLASDPFGLVGNATDVAPGLFDEHRSWDGIGSLTDAIAGLTAGQLRSASGVAAFDSAVAELKKLCLEAQASKGAHTEDAQQNDSLLSALETASGEASLLSRVIEQRARRVVEEAAARAIAKIHSVKTDDSKQLTTIVSDWLNDPVLVQEVDAYRDYASRQLAKWFAEHESTIEREFQAATVSASTSPRAAFAASGRSAVDGVVNAAGAAAGHAGQLAKALGNRDAVYAIGKQFGHRFKPWGAVKGGAKVAKVGVVLGAVAAAVDAKSMVDDHSRAQKHTADQDRAATVLRIATDDVVTELTVGADSNGPVAILQQIEEALGSIAAAVRTDAEAARDQIARLDEHLLTLGRLLDAADALGTQ